MEVPRDSKNDCMMESGCRGWVPGALLLLSVLTARAGQHCSSISRDAVK